MSKRKTVKNKDLNQPYVGVIIVLSSIILALIGLFDAGIIGNFLHSTFLILFGSFPQLFFIIIIVIGIVWLLYYKKIKITTRQIIAFVLIFIVIELLLVIFSKTDLKAGAFFDEYFSSIDKIYDRSAPANGGLFGTLFYSLFTLLFDKIGMILVTLLLFIVSLILLMPVKVNEFQEMIWNKEPKPKKLSVKPAKKVKLKNKDDLVKLESQEFDNFETIDMAQALKNEKSIFIDVKDEAVKQETTKQEPKQIEQTHQNEELENSSYVLPSISLLDKPKSLAGSSSNTSAANQKGEHLVNILRQFGIETTLVATHIGPAVTKFELKLDSGVKVSRISSLQDNLMMELAVKEIRIEAPIPGKNAVGVEIPNIEMTPVRLIELLKDIPEKQQDEKLLIALGKNLMGRNIFGQLNRMPHLLVAGATGSGKSVCINSMITTLMLRAKPNEVKLLLIDPKKVEFAVFEEIPHLIAPVVNDPVKAAKALNVVVKEMDSRYDKFKEVGARNIAAYNDMAQNDLLIKPMPRIVVIIDELADLMAVAGKEVETSIQRITQLARAAGIHLVVATQRPSVDVITGVIKANIPSRISFAVSSGTDSRTILDSTGAERLLGYGDMLYQPFGEQHPQRIQGVYITDDEVERVANEAKEQMKPHYEDSFMNLDGVNGNEGFVESNEDPLFEEIKEYVIMEQKASTSLLQRRFGIGYNRAAKMIDALEEANIIGPIQGSKPRDVYIKPSTQEESESLKIDNLEG